MIVLYVNNMGNFLAKSPLTAIFFAAVYHYLTPFLPFSQGYKDALAGFSMPMMGYVFLIAYGFLVSITIALVFGEARGTGILLAMVLFASLLLGQFAAPNLSQFLFGETTGVMSKTDTLFHIAQLSAATLLTLILSSLLFKRPPPPPQPHNTPPKKPDKYLLKTGNFIIILIVLPIIYLVFYFLAWYFLLWRNGAARVYYGGTEELQTFIQVIINMLLTNAKQVPMVLIKGLIMSLSLLPLLFQLPHKRVMFIVATILLYLGEGVQMLIPSAIMPDAVRTAHLIEYSALAVAFGGLAAFMLHTCMRKEPTKAPPVPLTPQQKAAAAAAKPQESAK